jgi:endonuclease YncB( thermonuclease family)
MKSVLILGFVALAALSVVLDAEAHDPDPFPIVEFPEGCTVEHVVDGDTFDCLDGPRVRLLQINAPERNDCGGSWATVALGQIFLRPGTEVRFQYDRVRVDRYNRLLAAPIVRGTDGADYNISIVMVYVGLARAAYYGDNASLLDWANASETWARNAQWNMWAPGGPFNGAAFCG